MFEVSLESEFISNLSQESRSWLARAIGVVILGDGQVDNEELISLRAAISFLEDESEIVEPAAGELVDACAAKPISATSSPEIFITSPAVCVREILPLNVTDDDLEIVESVASVWDANKWVGVPLWVIIISTPLALVSSSCPDELISATKSPMLALLIAVTTSLSLVTLEKSTVLPFIATWEADGIFEKLNSIVTKLLAVAVTLVELDIEYEKLAKANRCKNYIRVEALGINEYFIDSLSNLILNKEEYKFNNTLYPPKKRCPSNFVKCPCLN